MSLMQKNDRNKQGHIPYASRGELAVAILLACVNMVGTVLMLQFTEIPTLLVAIAIPVSFLVEMVWLVVYIRTRSHIAPDFGIMMP